MHLKMFEYIKISLIIVVFLNLILVRNAAHITGTFHPNEFFKLLIKFGFQKTERHSQRETFGYIYGNITSKDNFPVPITFAVLDKYNFLPYYRNRTLFNKDKACERMFANIDQMAFDKKCHGNNKLDFLRRIPCKKNELCVDEDAPHNVLPNRQFTYVMKELDHPRFWYISMVACYRNVTTCTWHYFDVNKFRAKAGAAGQTNSTYPYKSPNDDFVLSYDIHLVNGNPNQSSANPLLFQFSFDQQNVLEMNLIFFFVYIILVPLQIYAVRIQKHPVTKLFTTSLILEFVSLGFILSYYIRYAISGIGNETMKTTGDILDILSRTSFMLILLLLAKGWAVTRQQVTKSGWILLMSIWIPYCVFHIVLYVWNRTEVDIISDIDEYQTWPGWLVLASRSAIMLWFLWELRNTMKYEHSTKKLDFLLHFGASSLVWFIYLPIVAVVALQVSPLWRYKLLLGIINSADCLGYCVMTGLLWPNRAGQYLLLANTNYSGLDELDEFNEAPHSLRSAKAGNSELPTHNVDIDCDDNDGDEDDDDDADDDESLEILNTSTIIDTNNTLNTDLLINDDDTSENINNTINYSNHGADRETNFQTRLNNTKNSTNSNNSLFTNDTNQLLESDHNFNDDTEFVDYPSNDDENNEWLSVNTNDGDYHIISPLNMNDKNDNSKNNGPIA